MAALPYQGKTDASVVDITLALERAFNSGLRLEDIVKYIAVPMWTRPSRPIPDEERQRAEIVWEPTRVNGPR